MQNPKSEIAESEIAKSEIRNRKIRNSTSQILGKSKHLRLRRRRRNRKYRVQSVRQSVHQAVHQSVHQSARQSCVNRRVKYLLSDKPIGASPTQKYLLSDKTIGASKVRQSARLRRRNIWFSGCSIGASPTQEYLVQSNRHRSRISFRYGSIGASKMRQISGSPTAQSARQRCVKYLVLLLLNRRVIGLP